MNGVHDMGGMHGMGPVGIEPDEPVFHARWEARAFALTVACGAHGRWNIDIGRHSRERMPPAAYLAASYYERWLYGLQTLLIERGLVTAEELAAGRAAAPGDATRTLRANAVAAFQERRLRARMDVPVPPRFAQGERVVARNDHPVAYTRLPRYARGRPGVIERAHGVFVFADEHGRSGERVPQHLYGVRFAARDLWGAAAGRRDSVVVNLWESHLDPA